MVVVTDVVLVSAIMTDDIPRKILSDHVFLTFSFMVYRKIKNCDKFGKIRRGRQNYTKSAYVKIHVCSDHFEDGSFNP
jgi:hypothetical protein